MSKDQLLRRIKALQEQNNEDSANIELLEASVKEWRRKSDLMDILGGEESFRRVEKYGSLDNMFRKVEEYDNLKKSYDELVKRGRILEGGKDKRKV